MTSITENDFANGRYIGEGLGAPEAGIKKGLEDSVSIGIQQYEIPVYSPRWRPEAGELPGRLALALRTKNKEGLLDLLERALKLEPLRLFGDRYDFFDDQSYIRPKGSFCYFKEGKVFAPADPGMIIVYVAGFSVVTGRPIRVQTGDCSMQLRELNRALAYKVEVFAPQASLELLDDQFRSIGWKVWREAAVRIKDKEMRT